MGVWGLDIYDDDLAKDIKEEFEGYLMEGLEGDEAIDETITNNDNLLEETEEQGTFILTIALLAKENEISSKKVSKLLKMLEKNDDYWKYLKESSIDLYEARIDLMRELM